MDLSGQAQRISSWLATNSQDNGERHSSSKFFALIMWMRQHGGLVHMRVHILQSTAESSGLLILLFRHRFSGNPADSKSISSMVGAMKFCNGTKVDQLEKPGENYGVVRLSK